MIESQKKYHNGQSDNLSFWEPNLAKKLRPGEDGTPFIIAKQSESDDKRVGVVDGNGAQKKRAQINSELFL